MWFTFGHKEWCEKYCLNSDSTISPLRNKSLVFGTHDFKLILVKKGDKRAIKI